MKVPITGIMTLNIVDMDTLFGEDSPINPGFEAAVQDRIIEINAKLYDKGFFMSEYDIEERAREQLREQDNYDKDLILYGEWLEKDGAYIPDKDGLVSMILDTAKSVLQVVYSKTTITCGPASQEYLGLGDVEAEGELVAYMAPFVYIETAWWEKNEWRIVEND